MRRAGIGIAVFLAALGLAGVARSDVGGSLLPGGAFDLGVFYRELDRSVERDGQEETYTEGWWIGMIRIGVTDMLTASVELSSGLGSGSNDDFNYTVGAGLQTSMWTSGNMRATTRISYRRSLYVSRSDGGCDYLVQNIDWIAQFEQDFRIKNLPLTWWAGPTLSFLYADPEPPCNAPGWESSRLPGLIVGASIAGRRTVLAVQGTYIDALEPMVSIAWRF